MFKHKPEFRDTSITNKHIKNKKICLVSIVFTSAEVLSSGPVSKPLFAVAASYSNGHERLAVNSLIYLPCP